MRANAADAVAWTYKSNGHNPGDVASVLLSFLKFFRAGSKNNYDAHFPIRSGSAHNMIDTHLHHEVASYYERKSPKAHRRMQRRRTSTYFKSRWGRISIRSYRPEILIKSLGPNLTFFFGI